MRIRFLETTASQTPGYPFQAGQEIYLSGLTHEVRAWLKDGRAVVVPDDEPEAAVVGPDERAVRPRAKRRGC